MAKFTIKEIAAMSGDEYGEVAGLIKMLERRNLAKAVGHKANPPGVRGKPSTIYELDGAFDFVLFDDSPLETPGNDSPLETPGNPFEDNIPQPLNVNENSEIAQVTPEVM